MNTSRNRRDFLKATSAVGIGLTLGAATSATTGCATGNTIKNTGKVPRAQGKSVAGMRAPRLETVRVGVIGLGMRGSGAVNRLLKIEGVQVKALCDIRPDTLKAAQKQVTDAGRPAAAEYTGGPDEWMKLCERDDLDLVYACTPWELHTPNAVHAMLHGKHAAIEVPAAVTLEECWQLVDTSEKTQRHCMMLENCCYDFLELATLNMVRQGVFGELVHGEGAYIHDLRGLKFAENGYYDMWRLKHSMHRDGNLYPTHGLGPIAQCMDINRGDKFDFLTSISSNQFGLSLFAKEKYGPNSPQALQEYKLGDMNTTLIKTARGRSVMVQHDTTSPRPYSRIHLLSGTKACLRKWPEAHMAVEPNAHGWLSDEDFAEMQKKYQHPLVDKIGELARKVGGHGGMDFMMDWRLIACLRNGEPLDQDVYDAAAWSAVGPLSEASVAGNGAGVVFPDFTRGAWETAEPLGIVS